MCQEDLTAAKKLFMEKYSIISLFVFGLFTILILIYFFRERKKDPEGKFSHTSSLMQTIGTLWALWFAIFSIEQSNDAVIDSKLQIETQKKQIDSQITVLNNIAGTSGQLKNNLDTISHSMDSIAYKFSLLPFKVDDVSNSIIALNRTAYQQSKLYQRQFDIQVQPILKVFLKEYPTDDILQKTYSLIFYNDGKNTIYDIKVNKRLYLFSLITNSFGGYSYNNVNYWKEISFIDTLKKIEIGIPSEDIIRLKELLTVTINTSQHSEGSYIPLLIYNIKYRREIDRNEYSIRKYIMVAYDNINDHFWLDDLVEGKMPYGEMKERIINSDK